MIRSQELQAAAAELWLSRVELHRYPDGRLDGVPLDELAGHVLRVTAEEHPSHLVFDSCQRQWRAIAGTAARRSTTPSCAAVWTCSATASTRD